MGCCDAPGLMPIEEAMEKMLSRIKPIQTTLHLPLAQALGYVLAEDILSPIHVPPFDNSAMDGYAIRIADLKNNDTLPLAGKSFAGQPFEGEWPQNTCVRIMTGAKIPSGCDAVIMQENTEATENGIRFMQADVQSQANIRPTGDDIRQGDIVLAQGARLTPRDIPMIASLGVSKVTVYRKPKVAFFSTGDELKPLGETLESGQIYDSNRYGIKPLIENFGCEAVDLPGAALPNHPIGGGTPIVDHALGTDGDRLDEPDRHQPGLPVCHEAGLDRCQPEGDALGDRFPELDHPSFRVSSELVRVSRRCRLPSPGCRLGRWEGDAGLGRLQVRNSGCSRALARLLEGHRRR